MKLTPIFLISTLMFAPLAYSESLADRRAEAATQPGSFITELRESRDEQLERDIVSGEMEPTAAGMESADDYVKHSMDRASGEAPRFTGIRSRVEEAAGRELTASEYREMQFGSNR